MSGWKGERETRGVEMEETFKCWMCEVAEGCSWRVERVEEGLRRQGRRRGDV